ncbi:LysM peptidoglycan-binding domain-containing protein [Glycomyces sp. L485]|uniref:LysM peptidoglycan-binding domain-containing protein n=1 Tax=Glycomyces sp. L485 TaxID=2909235 RepID=UPI001F4B41C5|nr:LysM peptidoglycan-binding domain-containing protein [Glycomyces sp. L485]MCH7229954.1 LysM peptidoglycan-binding domain-containing protein [Glycomyces sp. L485]
MTRTSDYQNTPAGNGAGDRRGVDPTPAMRARTAAGIAIGAISLTVIIGVPALLYYFVGSRWPSRAPTLDDWESLHLRSETELFLGAVSLAAWIVWAAFTLACFHAVVVTAIDTARYGIDAQTWRDAANPLRWMAGLLIGAIVAIWPATAHAGAADPVERVTQSRALTGDELAQTTVVSEASEPAQEPATVTAWRTASADTATATTADTATEDETPTERRHTVTTGQTLWTIAAAYYGDPQRYPVIFEANQGRVFPDGRTFTRSDRIHPGWDLIIPDLAANDETDRSDTAASTTVIVGPYTTLWSLAVKYLGDGTRWPEIFEANQGRTFADGRTLTDPDLIIDGWELIIPAPAAPDTQPEHPDGDQEPAPPTDDGAIIDPGHDDPTQPTEPTEPETPESNPTTEGAGPTPDRTEPEASTLDAVSSIPVGIWLGTGTFLAGATAALILRRIRRHRRSAPAAPASGDDELLTGRLSDLETLIDTEPDRHATPEPELEPPGPSAPVAADREATADLFDLAETGLGLLGPGQRGAARAAIIAALEADLAITITGDTSDQLGLDQARIPAASGLTVAPDVFDALAAPARIDDPTLIVATGSDLDGVGANAFAEQLADTGAAAIVLTDWPHGPTFTLAANGTIEHANDETAAPIEQFYIADTGTLHAVLDTYRTADEPDQPTTPAEDEASPSGLDAPAVEATQDADPEPDEPEPEHPAEEHPEDSPTAERTGSRLRLCVFGEVDIYADGVPLVLKQRARAQTLLAVLACSDEPRTMTELMDIVVPDRPLKNARRYVNIIITNIRHAVRDALDDPTLDPLPHDKKTETFRLDADLIATDRAEFDDAEQAAALATDTAEQAAALERLAALHTGDLAPDVDALDDLRADYRKATERACRKLADYYSEIGDPARAAKYRTLGASA